MLRTLKNDISASIVEVPLYIGFVIASIALLLSGLIASIVGGIAIGFLKLRPLTA